MADRAILIADDDEQILELLKVMLEPVYKTMTVSNGTQLLKALEQDIFSMVITDLVMPDIDGLECISTIRKERKDIPILCLSGAFSASDDSQYLEIARSMGATATLTKPFNREDLFSIIEQHLPND